ncbi:MAG TPA: MmgE/PrpD family protein [Candidatus Elarobacter sp.]|nr:MmgE/PrpD family protein [Candidatus Elarobacter sp.]
MSSSAPAHGPSQALAAFAASAPDADARALDAARALLRRVDAEAPVEPAANDGASRDGAHVPPPRAAIDAAYGPPMRDAFETVIAMGDSGIERGEVAIVAAARAAARLRGGDETTTIRAIAIGREVALRLAGALAFDRAWDARAVCARIGATAAAARAAGLDESQARDALGLAATQAAGLRVARGSAAETATFAKIAPDALEAVVLARHGFTAAPASLEGRRGLAALMGSHFDAAAFVAGLGARWISAEG